MKKAYLAKGWLFPDRDLAMVSANEKDPLEIDVPKQAVLLEGRIDVYFDESKDGEAFFQLSPVLDNKKLDVSDLADYCPVIQCSSRPNHLEEKLVLDGHSLHTKNCSYQYDDLSEELRETIEQKANEFFADQEYDYEHFETDLNED